MKFLLVLLIIGMSFLSGCKQCGRYATFGECDGQITGDATPVAPTPPAAPTPGLTFSTLSSSLREIKNSSVGDNDTYTIVLNTAPSDNVTVSITSSDTTEVTVSPDNVTFSSGNYSIAQTITVIAVHDDEDDGDVNTTITNSISTSDSDYAALDNHTKSLTIVDVDTASVSITGSVYGPYVEGVAGPSWNIKLTTKPTDNVSITMEEDRPNQFTFPSALVFTPSNYSTAQAFTPTATNDNIIEGTHYVGLRTKATSNDSKYNNKYTRAPDAEVTDNGTGKQANNHISAGNYFVLAVDKVYTGNRVLYGFGDDTCGQTSGLTAETYGQCDYDQDNLSKVSNNGSGQLIPRTAENSYVIDNSSVGDNSSNVPILTGLTNIGKVVSNVSNSCVLFDNRTAVQCFGRYRMGSHPHGNSDNWLRQNSFTAKDIDVGYESAGIILDNGSVVIWGYGRTGMIGDSTHQYAHDGAVIASHVIDLAFGSHHACLLASNGIVTCHGRNEKHQLGSSTDTSNGCGSGVSCSKTPLAVEGFTNFVQIDAGNRHTAGVLDNGSLVVWGINESGECGMGSISTSINPPAISTTAPANVLKVWANGGKTCVATNKYKTLHCTGSAFVGDGSSTRQSSFVEIQFPSSFTSNHRILDVALTSGGGAVYTENIVNAFNGVNSITHDVFTWGSWSPVLGNGVSAVPVRSPVPIGSPF